MNKSNRNIISGAVMSYIMILVNIVSSMIYTPWLVKSLGQSDYALFTIASAIIPFFLMDFGLNSIISRYVARYHAAGEKGKINEIISFCYKFFIVLDFVILIVLSAFFFYIESFYSNFTITELEKFKVIFVITALFSVVNFLFNPLKSVLNAYEEFAILKSVEIFSKIFIMVTMCGAILLGFGLYALVFLTSFGNFIASIIYYIAFKNKCGVKFVKSKINKDFLKEIFSWSFYSVIAGYSSQLIFNVTPTILAKVSTVSAVAIFGVANIFEGYVYTFTSALSGLFLPKVSGITLRQEKSGDSQELLNLMVKIGRIQLILVGLIICGFTLIGKEFMLTWMGEEYLDAYFCALLIILPCIIELPQTIANTALIAAGFIRQWALVKFIIGIINIVLCILLSRIYGVFGAAFSIFIVYTLRTVLLNYFYVKNLHINLCKFFIECYSSMLLTFAITFVIGGIITSKILIFGWTGIAIKAGIIILIFGVMLYTTALNEFEKDLMNTIVNKVKSKLTRR